MDDLISRQAAIDGKIIIQRTNGVEIYYDEAVPVGYLKRLPSVQPEPQWIPVSERLPEEPGYYITSNEYNGVGEDFYYDGHFWNADKNAYSVIAWMPKPKPFEGGTE